MKPADALRPHCQHETERVEIDQLAGRITVGLVTLPPGIPLLIPGEVFSQKIVDYLLFAREFPSCALALKPTSTAWWKWKTSTARCAFTPIAWPSLPQHLLQSPPPKPKKPKPARPNKALWPWPQHAVSG